MLEIINYILAGSYGLSTIITAVNNFSSNSRIKRKGYEIKPITNNSALENIKYFIKDFGFLIIPIYNLIHSIRQTAKKDSEFDSNRMEILEDRDRLVKVEDKKSEKTSPAKKRNTEARVPSKVETKETTKKEEKKREPKKVEDTTQQEKSLEEMSCYERREYYRNEYNELLDLRNRAKQTGKSVQILNAISHEMQSIVDEYKKADRECKLEDLKTEKNVILTNIEEPIRLIRK